MILFVDYEHESGRDGAAGQRLLAARTWLSYRLQDLTGMVCLLQHYTTVTPALIDELAIKAMFISGNRSDPSTYGEADLAGIAAVIRDGTTPTFGFCGGHQLLATILGASLQRLGRSSRPDASTDPTDASHWEWELGYRPIDTTAGRDHPLLAGLGASPVMRHAHSWELASVPPGFDTLATTEKSRHQLIAHRERPLVGAQFHPEYFTDEHPAGRRLIENFCTWSGVPITRGAPRPFDEGPAEERS